VDNNTMTRTQSGSRLARLLRRLDSWTLYAFNPVFPHNGRPTLRGRS
jgi:hypothetical protein